MAKKLPLAIALLATVLLAACGSDPYNPSNEVSGMMDPSQAPAQPATNDPSEGRFEQARGFYSRGTLVNATKAPLETPSMVQAYPAQNRNWSTSDLLYVVATAADALRAKFPHGERLQLGDFSLQKGGPIAPHSSHENGLDADLYFYRTDGKEQRYGKLDDFITPDGKWATEVLDKERQWHFLKEVVASGRVHRMFVNQAIKNSLCVYVKRIGEYEQYKEVFRLLRPEAGHNNHVHVRIGCPARSPSCKNQLPVGPDVGCPN